MYYFVFLMLLLAFISAAPLFKNPYLKYGYLTLVIMTIFFAGYNGTSHSIINVPDPWATLIILIVFSPVIFKLMKKIEKKNEGKDSGI